MNVIGERVKVLSSTDPTFIGRTGVVVLESANTLTLASDGVNTRIQKAGLALMLAGSGRVVAGVDIAGRLQDRLRRRQ
jgi:RNase P/RNase MRP subunit p29